MNRTCTVEKEGTLLKIEPVKSKENNKTEILATWPYSTNKG